VTARDASSRDPRGGRKRPSRAPKARRAQGAKPPADDTPRAGAPGAPRRIRVGVVFGGRSGEHEVSLASAASILAAIDSTRYEVVPMGITKDGHWLVGGNPLRALARAAGVTLALPEAVPGHPDDRSAPGRALARVATAGGLPAGPAARLDVVFPVLHGPYGEDGTLQGLLELADVPYVGAGVCASAVGMDKATMKAVFRAHALPTVPHLVLRDHEWRSDPGAWRRRVAAELGYPCFVKPANLGSSVGISKVAAERALDAGVEAAFAHDRKILVERGVTGREIEVSVLGNDEPEASVPGEVLPGRDWYDYEAKYTDGIAKLLIPAPLPPALVGEFRRLAVEAFRAIDAAGLARVDFFLDTDDRIWVNEINTIPGFTRFSAYPRLWEATGLSYRALVDRLIALALERYAGKRRHASPAPPGPEPGGGA
jgi:D-alanine-D-alanine ligase